MESYDTLENYIKANKLTKNIHKGSYIGLKRLAMGFCIYAANPVEFYKFSIDERLHKAGLLSNKDSLDILVSCIYDDSSISKREYYAKISHLKNMVWYPVSEDSVANHPFLKKLFETDESEDNPLLTPLNRIYDFGIDESELRDSMRSDNEESKQNEFDSENTIDDDF